jgi:adenylate cyclase class 2
VATEIELKAHVENSEALRILLTEKAEYSFAFEKEDVYWQQKQRTLTGASGSLPLRFRLRREKRILPDGTEELMSLMTFKKKEVRAGIEINDEKEFEIACVQGEINSSFEEFLALAGLEPGFAKKKKGWAFQWNRINAELLEVKGLGWFLELEIMAKKEHEENLEIARDELLSFLDNLGLAREKIESRFYSEMLKGENNA